MAIIKNLYFQKKNQQNQTKLSNEPLTVPQTELSDFYMTNPVSRNSVTMAKCVKSFESRQNANKKTQHQAV